MIVANGCWADYRIAPERADGRPCLFLDRDGVLIEDTGYPHNPAAILFIPETLDLVQAANSSGFVTGIVSNQSGIGRGYFGWDAFAAVQREIDAALAERGGRLDFVLACPHLGEAITPQHRCANHPWRKPNPGMMRDAAEHLGLDVGRSIMIGDRDTDLRAAAAAGIRHRVLLDATPASGQGCSSIRMGRTDLRPWFSGFGSGAFG